MKRQSGLTLIEVVAVATLTVLVAIGAMRLLTIFADETNFATRLSIDSRQADYSRMIGVVQDRITQAWDYTLTTNTTATATNHTLALYDSNGDPYATISQTVQTNRWYYGFADNPAIHSVTTVPLSLTYNFTNATPTTTYQMWADTNTTVHWKMPPPMYINADASAFVWLLGTSELATQLAELKNNNSPALQHQIKTFHFNPEWYGYR